MIELSKLRDELMNIGPDHSADVETAYKNRLGRSEKQELENILPDLIVPYADEAVDLDEAKNWVPVHAWRLLRRLRSPAGLIQMLSVADHSDDQLAYSEFVESALAAGPEAVCLLLPIVGDKSRSDTQRILAVKGLAVLAQDFSNVRSDVVSALSALISGTGDPGGDINGFAAEGLMAMDADCADLIATAYNAGKVQVGSVRAAILGTHFGFEP